MTNVKYENKSQVVERGASCEGWRRTGSGTAEGFG